jgi:hypothetical protein
VVRVVPLVLVVVVAAAAIAARRDGRPSLGLAAGSLASAPPAGESLPTAPAFVVPELPPPIPSSQWWSSLVALPFSERQYPHPLAVTARPEGFQIRYPGPDIHADEHCICGWMDVEPPNDLILGNSEVARFDAARLAGYSDWFVTARFEAKGRTDPGMEVTYGHGSPFVFGAFTGRRSDRAFPRTARGLSRERRRERRRGLSRPPLLSARRSGRRALVRDGQRHLAERGRGLGARHHRVASGRPAEPGNRRALHPPRAESRPRHDGELGL